MFKNIIIQRYGSILLITFLISSSLLSIVFLNSKLNSVEAASTWTQTSDQDFFNGEFKNITMI